jgi:GNAT superfamily N-acetyltransferase
MGSGVQLPGAGLGSRDLRPPAWRLAAIPGKDVRDTLVDAATKVWVAEAARGVVGFVAAKLHPERQIGELWMLAVDPDEQGRGIGTALTEVATGWLREAGMTVAMVETGDDSGHAPARRVYEKAGYTLLPVARYFKAL